MENKFYLIQFMFTLSRFINETQGFKLRGREQKVTQIINIFRNKLNTHIFLHRS